MTGEISDIESINNSIDELLTIAKTQTVVPEFDYGVYEDADVHYESCQVPFQIARQEFDQRGRGRTDTSTFFAHKVYAGGTDSPILRRAVELYLAGNRPGRELTISQAGELLYRHKEAESPLFGAEFKRVEPLAVGVGGLKRANSQYAERFAKRMAYITEVCKSTYGS